MITAKLSAQPAPRGVAERAQPAAIPGPVGRVVSDDACDSRAFSGDGGSEAGGILPHGPFGRRAASRELPDELVAGAVRGDGGAREELLALI